MADAEPPAPQDLPAPYVNPWGLLGRDLLAVLASLRLQLWQLWRRNRQGDLPLPRFWPQVLAGWFWPALLALLLVLLVAGGRGLLAFRAGLSPGPPSQPAAEAPSLPVAESPSQAGAPVEASPSLPLSPPGPAQEGTAPGPPPPSTEPPLEQPPPEEPLASAPPPDPLLEALAGEERAELLLAARVREPDGALELVLERSGWQQQAPAQRQRLAEQWQRRAAALGHERLWLLDPQGAPLGRSARVGSGMILLAPSLPADDP